MAHTISMTSISSTTGTSGMANMAGMTSVTSVTGMCGKVRRERRSNRTCTSTAIPWGRRTTWRDYKMRRNPRWPGGQLYSGQLCGATCLRQQFMNSLLRSQRSSAAAELQQRVDQPCVSGTGVLCICLTPQQPKRREHAATKFVPAHHDFKSPKG